MGIATIVMQCPSSYYVILGQSQFRYHTFTCRLNIHDYFTFDNEHSGYQYSNNDWDVGSLIRVESGFICIYYDLSEIESSREAVLESIMARKKTIDTTDPHNGIDEDAKSSNSTTNSLEAERIIAEAMKRSRPDKQQNCFSSLRFDILSFMKNSLRLQPGDRAVFKPPSQWPNFDRWTYLMESMMTYSVIPIIKGCLFLTIPIFFDKFKWCAALYIAIIGTSICTILL